jgi:hypothetical protein
VRALLLHQNIAENMKMDIGEKREGGVKREPNSLNH